jgi:hypothetical protein
VLLLVLLPLAAGAEPVQWPGGASVAVSLTYDDALDSQLDVAAPALQRHDLKGTFYLVPGNLPVARRLGEWRQLAQAGHELGNHTLYHGCRKSLPDRDWVRDWDDLDRINPEQLLRDIRTANTAIAAIDGQSRRTFAAPCYDLEVSGEYFPDDIVADFAGIRDLAQGVDESARSILAPVELSGAQLIGWVESNTRPGALLVFVFHGVGGDYLAVSAEAHEQLLTYLVAHRDTYWTASYLDIMDHVLGTQPIETVNR